MQSEDLRVSAVNLASMGTNVTISEETHEIIEEIQESTMLEPTKKSIVRAGVERIHNEVVEDIDE